MFNSKYVVSMKMFSVQHIVTVLVILSIILVVFAFRKYFMNHSLADKIFRYSIAILMLGLEIGWSIFSGVAKGDSLAAMLPKPLCGHIMWIVGVALFSDSRRIMKLFFPMAMTGGTLSLIFINMEYSFPHFRAFHYFGIHSIFMLAVMYFYFTRKIITYRWRDFGWSCFTLLSMAAFIFMLNSFHFEDSYFLIDPPPGLEAIKESVGQTAWTLLYILAIAVIMGIFGGVLYLCTRKRDEKPYFAPSLKKNKFISRLSKFTVSQRVVTVFSPIILFVYLTVLQNMSHSKFLFAIDFILLVLIYLILILNEVSLNYKECCFDEK